MLMVTLAIFGAFMASSVVFRSGLRRVHCKKLRAIDSLNRQNQACIEGSTTLEALDRCHRQSRQAMHALRESFHRQISQLRDSYGLPKPNQPQQHRHGQANQS
jgi:hypothetical protein